MRPGSLEPSEWYRFPSSSTDFGRRCQGPPAYPPKKEEERRTEAIESICRPQTDEEGEDVRSGESDGKPDGGAAHSDHGREGGGDEIEAAQAEQAEEEEEVPIWMRQNRFGASNSYGSTVDSTRPNYLHIYECTTGITDASHAASRSIPPPRLEHTTA
jgi:hypothetical protein